MTTITLKINDKTTKGKSFFEFLNQYILTDKTVELVKEPNEKTLKAVKNVRLGKTVKTSGVKDFLKQMNE